MSLSLRVLALLVLSIFSLTISACKMGDASRASDVMVDHFAGSCRASVGTWTTAALQQTQSMITVLEAVKETQAKDCAGLSSALQATQQIHQRLQQIIKDPAINSYRSAEQKKLELTLALSSAAGGDPVLVDTLRQELYNTELELVQAKANFSTWRNENDKMALINGLSDMSSAVVELTNQGNMSACLASAPHMPLGIASSLLAIAGNFATPFLGSQLGALGNLMQQSVLAISRMPIDKMELDLENTRMQTALTCSLESMSELYCDAADTGEFIEFALESYKSDGRAKDVWRGMDLLGKRLPVLNRWMNKVTSGVDPSDTFAAQRLNNVWEKQNKVREVSNLVRGQLNKTRELIEGVTDPVELQLRTNSGFKAIIKDMYGDMFSSGREGPNPFKDAKTANRAVCDLSGAGAACDPSDSMATPDSLIDTHGVGPDFNLFTQRVDTFIAQVETLVYKELLSTINQDPDILVAEATEASISNWSPLKVLNEVSVFASDYATMLRKLPPKPGAQRTIKLADDTAVLFKKIADEIAGANPSVDVIKTIFTEFKLVSGPQFVNQRVGQLVNWELQTRVDNGQLPPDVSGDLIAAGIALTDQLERAGIYIQSDADELLNDIKNAKATSQGNLSITVKAFAPTIAKLMGKLADSAKRAGETDWTEPNYSRLAQLCILTLTTNPEWPKGIDIGLCKHATVISAYKNSGLRMSFDELRAKFQGPNPPKYEQRVCTYHKFLRASRLFLAPRPSGSVQISSFDAQTSKVTKWMPNRILEQLVFGNPERK